MLEVFRRAYDSQPEIVTDPHCHHVTLNKLANMNASIKPAGHQLDRIIRRRDFEYDFWKGIREHLYTKERLTDLF